MSELILAGAASAAKTRALIAPLCERSDAKALHRLVCHLAVLAFTGWWVVVSLGSYWLIPALIVHGVVIGTLFSVVHEGVHYTAFKTRWINEVIAWVAGTIIGLNSSFYRQFHYEHHRHTQQPGRDPELGTIPPRTLWEYVLRISAVQYWQARIAQTFRVILGDFAELPYVPSGKRRGVRISMAASALVYLGVMLLSLFANSAIALWLWLVPLLIGQPVLRFWLLCEHTGCSNESDGFLNTRTTLTVWPVRFLMWNMPYHAEHHLHPQIPFHALPDAHQRIGHHFKHVATGYIATNLQLLGELCKGREAVRTP